MKIVAVIVSILLLAGIFTACQPAEEPTVPSFDPSRPVFLYLEKLDESHEKGRTVKMGQVVFSEDLLKTMKLYPEGTEFGIEIVFSAVYPEGLNTGKEREAYFAKLREWFEPCGVRVDYWGSKYSVIAYATLEAVESMNCAEDMALYVTGVGQYK